MNIPSQFPAPSTAASPAAEPQGQGVWCGSQASELRDIQRGGEDAAYRNASGATTLSYSVPAKPTPPEPGQCLVDSWLIAWLVLRLQEQLREF